MSGDVQPRKRRDKKRKKEDTEDTPHKQPHIMSTPLVEDDVNIHVHNDHDTGGGLCAKFVFFILLAILAILIGLIITEHRGLTDLEAAEGETRFSQIFEGWTSEKIAADDHGHDALKDEHDDEEHDELDEEEDHDEHDEEEEEVDHGEEEEEDEGEQEKGDDIDESDLEDLVSDQEESEAISHDDDDENDHSKAESADEEDKEYEETMENKEGSENEEEEDEVVLKNDLSKSQEDVSKELSNGSEHEEDEAADDNDENEQDFNTEDLSEETIAENEVEQDTLIPEEATENEIDAENSVFQVTACRATVGVAILAAAYVVLVRKWKSECVIATSSSDKSSVVETQRAADIQIDLARRNTIIVPPTAEIVKQKTLKYPEDHSDAENGRNNEKQVEKEQVRTDYKELRKTYEHSLTDDEAIKYSDEHEEYDYEDIDDEDDEVDEEEDLLNERTVEGGYEYKQNVDDDDEEEDEEEIEEEEEEEDSELDDEDLMKKLEEKYGKLTASQHSESTDDEDIEDEEYRTSGPPQSPEDTTSAANLEYSSKENLGSSQI